MEFQNSHTQMYINVNPVTDACNRNIVQRDSYECGAENM